MAKHRFLFGLLLGMTVALFAALLFVPASRAQEPPAKGKSETLVSGPTGEMQNGKSTAPAAPQDSAVFCNTAPIPVSDRADNNGPPGKSNPYPSVINVSSLPGAVDAVTVTLKGFTSTWPADMDVLLVAPDGHSVLVLSDAGHNEDISNVDLALTDSATAYVPFEGPLTSGTYRPTDYTTSPANNADVFPAPAPGGPYVTTLSSLQGVAANGDWKLYITDDSNSDVSAFNGGWCLEISTTGSPCNSTPINIADRTSAGSPPGIGSPYPSNISIAGVAGTVQHVSVALQNINSGYPDDMDVLLRGPNGHSVVLMSDAGGYYTISGVNLTFDDSAAHTLSDTAQLMSGTYKPTNYDTSSDTWPSPAPVGPYDSALSAFNGSSPNGTWSLFAVDDTSGDTSAISGGWCLYINDVGGCTTQFVDAPPSSPFYTYIQCLACRGVMQGYACGAPDEPCPGTYFRPGSSITRGQLSKIVANAAGFAEVIPDSRQTYYDVKPGSTFWLYVERLTTHGAIAGYTCGQNPAEPCDDAARPYFRPGDNVTRGQTSKIVAQAANNYSDIPANRQTYSDVPSGSTFWVYIERLSASHVMSGYACGQNPDEQCDYLSRPYFRPGLNVTRGQASKIVANTFHPECSAP